MLRTSIGRIRLVPIIGLMLICVSGCSKVISSATSGMAEDLSAAIQDQDDPELVREAVPAFLLLLDAMVRSSPDSPATLGAAAELYAVYGTAFIADPARAKVLTRRGRNYGLRALCADDDATCAIETLAFDEYSAVIGKLDADVADSLYSYSMASLAYIRAHSADFGALTDLPKIEFALKQLLAVESSDAATINMYLGILNTLRPPALGGQPEVGRAYFETAIDLSGDKDLSVKVEYARGYARLLYDRELHDRLLNEVLEGQINQAGYTLVNSLAQQQARDLLASADEYF